MESVEKVCIQSYTAPPNLELKHCLPHNYLFDLPIQSREVSKQIDPFKKSPVLPSMKLSASMTLPVFDPVEFNFIDLQKDPLQCILEEKEEFLNQLKGYLIVAKGNQKRDSTFMRNVSTSIDREFFLANQNIVSLAECLAKDPHPYFSESYVWLPVGGSIKHLSIGNKTCIIAPDGKKFDNIRVVPIAEKDGWVQDGEITKVDCSPGDRILQVVTSKQKKKGYVGVRQLRRFHVVRLKPSDDEGSLKGRKLIDVSYPVDALNALDISSLNGESACTIDTSSCVKIYDIAAGKCTVDQKIDENDGKNNSKEENGGGGKFIQFSKDPFIVYIINRRKLYLKDIRQPFTSAGTTFNVYDLDNGCEVLNVCAESVVSDMLYCASTHHCYCLDSRRGWLKRWSHGLDDMPLYLNVGVTESLKEMIATGTIEMGSVTGMLNTWEESEGGIRQSFCSFPAALPSVRDTAFWANTKGLWLEPSIAKRIESSLCGMTIIPSKIRRGCSLFSLNAVGDVFCTSFLHDKNAEPDAFLVHNTPEATGRGMELVEQWQEAHMNFISKSKMNMRCKSTTDRSYLLTIMKQHLNKDLTAREHVHKWRRAVAKGKMAYRPRSRINKDKPIPVSRLQKLTTYKDWLASELLSFWNMNTLIEQARLFNSEGQNALILDSEDSS